MNTSNPTIAPTAEMPESTPEDTSVNGYSNHDTYLMAVLFDNEEHVYHDVVSLAQAYDPDEDEDAIEDLAEDLAKYVKNNPEILDNWDIDVDDVDFEDIADTMLDDYRDNN